MLTDALRLARYAARMATKPQLVTIDGLRLAVPERAGGKVLASIYAEKYEGLEARAIARLLREDDVVVEAGAAIGFIGLVCARVVGPDNVIMIEANADLLPVIRRNFEENGHGAPSLIHGLAAAEDGPAVPFQVAEQFWSSSTLDRGQTARVDAVRQVGLNALFRERRASVFICDIEGGEFALLPALDLSPLRLVMIELHEHLAGDAAVAQAVASIEAQGFALRESFKDEVFIFARKDAA